MPDAAERGAGASSSDRELVCACENLNLGDYKSFLAGNADATFEEVLVLTKAGTTCTACLLDLEYHFVASSHQAGSGETSASAVVASGDERSIKRRIFDFLDRHSPLVPFKLVERLPVIAGPGIEQRLWVSNRSLLFEGNRSAPAYKLEVTIRDASGKVRHIERCTVAPEAAFELPVSPFITAPGDDGSLSIGSMEIRRSSTMPGVRGTTRPQTEILAPNGACSVHAQAYKTAGEKWFTTFHQPADQRVFLSYINFKKSPLNIELRYPMNADDIGVPARSHKFVIPPFGAVLIELDPLEVEKLGQRELTLNWTSDGEYNCHIFCATPDLTRMSIDHS